MATKKVGGITPELHGKLSAAETRLRLSHPGAQRPSRKQICVKWVCGKRVSKLVATRVAGKRVLKHYSVPGQRLRTATIWWRTP